MRAESRRERNGDTPFVPRIFETDALDRASVFIHFSPSSPADALDVPSVVRVCWHYRRRLAVQIIIDISGASFGGLSAIMLPS